MENLQQKLDDNFLTELNDVINEATIGSMQKLFDYNLVPTSNIMHYKDAIIGYAPFFEGYESFKFCFVFEREFLDVLMPHIYGPEIVKANNFGDLCLDTVSELVNIISNQIKVYFNNNGFVCFMKLPYAEFSSNETDMEAESDAQGNEILNSNFSSPSYGGSSESIICIRFRTDEI